MKGYNSTSSGTNPDQHSTDCHANRQIDETTRDNGQLDQASQEQPAPDHQREVGGRKKGLEPTRYGDWEKDGRCIDF